MPGTGQPRGPRARTLTVGARALPLAEAARRLGVALDPSARAAARRLPLRFPAPYAALVRPEDPHDPIRRIAWPDPEELAPDPGAFADPVGEDALHPHPALVRKYPDRALLLLTSRCHFYCRFCFRAGHGADPSEGDVNAAIELLARDPLVREVILSGGDPLVLPDAALARVLRRLARIPSLERVRLHTRAPVHDPARVTAALARTLAAASPAPLRVVLHATHPRELTADFEGAVARLRAAGFPVLDQSVLLRGVNADVETLAALFEGLAARGVAPYYLHHPDRIAGTARFRVGIEDGLALWGALRARVAAEALPRYVLDLPDGSGKVDVEALERVDARRWRVAHRGRVSIYEDF